MDYPKEIEKLFEKIIGKGYATKEDLESEYEEEFNKEWIQSDEFADDEDRHQYLFGVFNKNYLMRPPAEPNTIIPIGLDQVRTSRKGKIYSSIYVMDSKGKLKRVAINGEIADPLTSNLNLFHKYEDIKLGRFGDDGDYIADDRTKFESPIKIKATPKALMKKLEIPSTTINDALDNLSKVGSDGFVVNTDWRHIRGWIKGNGSKNTEDPYNEKGAYRLVDNSIDTEEEKVRPDGTIIPPGMTLWISPKMMNYPADSYVDAYGPISEGKDKNGKSTGDVSMSCCVIVPVHAPPIEEGE